MAAEADRFVEWFRAASPYIHVHRGRTFVVQFDDAAIESPEFGSHVNDLALLHGLGVRLVLVFGARSSVERNAKRAGIRSKFQGNVRITDEPMLEVVKSAAGRLLIEVQARLSMGLANTPMSNAEVRVTSGNFVTARPIGIVGGVDFQFSGKVRNVEVQAIRSNLEGHETVLIPPVGYSVTGEVFNLEARALAAQVAVEVHADKLIYLSESEGITDSGGELLRELTREEAEEILGTLDIDHASRPYLEQAVFACGRGVRRVHFVSRHVDGAVLRELFTRDGFGTMVSLTSYDELRRAGAADISGIIGLTRPLELDGTLVERSREKLELDIDHYTVMVRDGVIIGCAALYNFPGECGAELACLAVHPDYHEGGRGEQLLQVAEREAHRAGTRELFVLTTRAEHWFLERGFLETTVDDLPVERRQLYNYQRNSKVLVKKL